ncbi:hypothetical protein GUA87_06525 [Sneathiella sp. P13V-1]|uniref:anti-sigma factor family protein n=1 Tax=Sneathiella sp. P13V-1 TaxID=2697366 RepID=UPI00187BA918|nr:hypothetical protein [Sneathiella sp. P13V-1]MBE7636495.1 hypothetical protein [Sneathiella sp. P13V-1]
MAVNEFEWQKLNAYVDGELSPEETRMFMKGLHDREDLKAEYEKLIQLKSNLSALAPVAKVPVQETAIVSKRFRNIAAAIVLAFGLGSSLVVWNSLSETSSPEKIHATFSEKTYLLDKSRPALHVSSFTSGDFDIPDLTLTRLQLADIQTRGEGENEVISAHYRGYRGCRLTLVSTAGNKVNPDGIFQFSKSEKLLKISWSSERAAFTLLATGMDKNRFMSIANYVRDSISEKEKKRESLKIAMHEAYKSALPCA